MTNKTEFVSNLASKQNRLSKRGVNLAVNSILKTMQEGLKAGRRIEIRGFGSFSMRLRPGRERINLSTGQPRFSPESYVLYFRPAKELKSRVNASGKIKRQKPSGTR